ncbi:hypothetical protein [Martelella mediterranea]|uniref:hypothetical protein n=1 Tax=Martelella mediterranea TaxID=293089 RepID=UPI001F18C413|nr:hypothetical protein [Martelella mediterranea]
MIERDRRNVERRADRRGAGVWNVLAPNGRDRSTSHILFEAETRKLIIFNNIYNINKKISDDISIDSSFIDSKMDENTIFIDLNYPMADGEHGA